MILMLIDKDINDKIKLLKVEINFSAFYANFYNYKKEFFFFRILSNFSIFFFINNFYQIKILANNFFLKSYKYILVIY